MYCDDCGYFWGGGADDDDNGNDDVRNSVNIAVHVGASDCAGETNNDLVVDDGVNNGVEYDIDDEDAPAIHDVISAADDITDVDEAVYDDDGVQDYDVNDIGDVDDDAADGDAFDDVIFVDYNDDGIDIFDICWC